MRIIEPMCVTEANYEFGKVNLTTDLTREIDLNFE